MVKTKVGYSENPEAYLAGIETADKAHGKEAKVGLLFTSVVMDQQEILRGIRSVTDMPVIGCTSSAAICTHDGYLNKETGYAGMMTFSGDLEVCVAGSPKTTTETARQIGKRIAKEAMSQVKETDVKPAYFFMTASPAEEEEYMKGVQDVIGDIPVFGGGAADNTVEGKWSIICKDQVFSDGCAIALFFAKNEMKNIYTGFYKETNNVGIITKVNGARTLAEIDGVPAVKKYCEWTGKTIESVMGSNLLTETIFAPLGVKDPIDSVVAVRHPMFANDDLSMNIGANLAVNTAVIQLEGSPETIVAANPDVALVSLTGATSSGKETMKTCSSNLTHVMLELGGNDAFILDKDGDVDLAVEETIWGRFYNTGQVCCASKRFLIHRNVLDEYVSKLKERISKIKLGMPSDPTVQLGCLVSEQAAINVEKQVNDMVALGARIELGGQRDGAFYRPTILMNVTRDMPVAKDMEIFGPVVSIIAFDDINEAIEIANQSSFGLCGCIISRDINNAMKVAGKLECGGVIINGASFFRSFEIPFGGWKYSGIGNEGVMTTLKEMSRTKTVILKTVLK